MLYAWGGVRETQGPSAAEHGTVLGAPPARYFAKVSYVARGTCVNASYPLPTIPEPIRLAATIPVALAAFL